MKPLLLALTLLATLFSAQAAPLVYEGDTGPGAGQHIVFLASDHGFHVGGKEALYKQTLWDSGTRIPFIVSGLNGMPKGVTCQQPISLIDVYPTFVDICGLPKDPNAGRSGYPLEGHSIKPLMLDPGAGKWTGLDVAIMALPGKDHSQHREHIGTMYPHFSVRARDWRYSLTSDGQEELYHYPKDPNEFTNQADNPEFAEIKAKLRAQLVALRDGDTWQTLDALPADKLVGFELLAGVKGSGQFKLGKIRLADVASNDWAAIRIRVVGKRSQVWLNNRLASDKVQETPYAPGVVTAGCELRNIRLRKL